ncbi:hypothetical protein E2C01_024239 [Portunus trituberculatus]|uniref:Uncharacterized protein n=1 Tax=Portunus trituberculatus TaxID=210409 RepID=A0A5B7EBQ9_PORTR|nr:hypothetical protein [Portunus trituberculatus]
MKKINNNLSLVSHTNHILCLCYSLAMGEHSGGKSSQVSASRRRWKSISYMAWPKPYTSSASMELMRRCCTTRARSWFGIPTTWFSKSSS